MKTNNFFKKIAKGTILATILGGIIFLAACGGSRVEGQPTPPSNQPSRGAGPLANQLAWPEVGEEFAVMVTNHGDIYIRLFPEYAPLAVENLIGLANDGFYDGLIFHRVIEEFMIQGGCPYGQGFGGTSIWGGSFEDEFSPNMQHIRGALSMANSGPNTNSSQFFIVQNTALDPWTAGQFEAIYESHLDEFLGYTAEGVAVTYRDVLPPDFLQHFLSHGGTPSLNNIHTVFGQVFYGMDVVDSIATTPTAPGDRPLEDVIIETIEIRTWQ